MATLKFCKNNIMSSSSIPNHVLVDKFGTRFRGVSLNILPLNYRGGRRRRNNSVKACSGSGGVKNEERRNFLSLEEAGLVEMSGLSTHERFLCRLTISSLNLLRVISEQEGCSIEELNAGRICDWFLKDKLKREQNLETAVLQWDEDPIPPFQH